MMICEFNIHSIDMIETNYLLFYYLQISTPQSQMHATVL